MRQTFRLLTLSLVCCGFLFFARESVRHMGAAIPTVSPAANPLPVPATDIPIPKSSSPASAPLALDRSTEGAPGERTARDRVAGALLSEYPAFELAAKNAAGVQFVAHSPDMTVALASDGIHVALKPQEPDKPGSTLDIRVRGNANFVWQGQEKLAAETNYFLGNDPMRWRTHVSRYARAETSDDRPVSLSVYNAAPEGSDGRAAEAFEYDIRTGAYVDASKLRLELRGAKDLRIDHEGNLEMRVGGHELRMNAPGIYEDVAATTTAHTRKKSTSTVRKRASTSTHSTPRGARRETTPRKSQSRSANADRSRLRKSMHDDPHKPKKKQPSRTLRKPPFGGNSPPAKKTPPKQPKAPSLQQSGRRIQGGYILEADGSVGLWIGGHDPSAALVIDPSLTLTYETFLGGAGADSVTSMAIGSDGSVYLGGTTNSAASFPEGAGTDFDGTQGNTQLFIAKVAFAAPGSAGTLQYLSFFGGSATQAGGQVAVDPSGNAAILGVTTSIDYPVTDGSVPTSGLTANNGNDVVVSEVDPTGANLIFSTLFGGDGSESQNAATGIPLNSSQNIPAAEGGIAFDASGNIYIASDTTSTKLPTTTGAYQATFGGGIGPRDGFLAEFQPQNVASGSSDLLYATYLGTHSDGAVAIGGVAVGAVNATDTNGIPNVYIAGLSDNQFDGFPVANSDVQSSYGGGSSDAFLMKISPAGGGTADLIYATLLGGQCMDEALGVAVDTAVPANAYVVGATESPSFIAEAPSIPGPSATLNQTIPFQSCPSGNQSVPPTQNAFVAVVAQNSATQATSLQYFTYLGGSQQDAAQAVSAAFSDSVYVGGTTTSYDFGWRDNLQAFNGSSDAFVVNLDTTKSGSASLLFATPLGGTFQTPGTSVVTLGNGIAADSQGDAYVAGATTAVNFPTGVTSGGQINGFQSVCGSCQESPPLPDAFLVGIKEGDTPQPAASFNLPHLSFGSPIPLQTPPVTVTQAVFLTNTGDGDATLSLFCANPPVVTGVNAADFSVAPIFNSYCSQASSACPLMLKPAQACQLIISFTPSIAGVEAGTLTVADNGPGSPQLLEVTGSAMGLIEASPAGLDFGDVTVNSASPPVRTVTLAPQSGVQIGCSFVVVPSNSPFSWVQIDCPEPGQTLTAGFRFNPLSAGAFQAEIGVYRVAQGGADELAFQIPVSGTGVVGVPIAVVTPAAINFGNQSVGTTGVARAVSIGNTGDAPLGFTGGIVLTGANASDFSVGECSSTVAPQGGCTVLVKFAPQSVGNKTAALTINDNAAGSPQTVMLTGVATATPQVQVSPTSWGFAPQSVGSQSAAETIAVTNVGTLSVNFTQNISITGTNASDFSETSCNLQVALQPGAQCNINVVFTPGGAGNRAATLTVTDNAAGSPQTVTLSGMGLQANAQLNQTSLQFVNQSVGTSSGQTVIVTSAGPGQPLKISCVSIVPCGSAPSTTPQDFTESDNCKGSSITTSCTVQVTFTPLCGESAASRQATLTIQDNGAISTQTVGLTGTVTGDFCFTPTSGLTDTVAAGSTANFPPIKIFSLPSASGQPVNVNVTCSSAPAGPTCTTSPPSPIALLPPGNPQILNIQATTSTSSMLISPGGGIHLSRRSLIWAEIAISLFAAVWLLFARRRPKWTTVFAALALIVLCVMMGSCGGNTASVASDPPGPVTYTLTVTASDGTQSQNVQLQLTVTPQ